MKLSGFGTLWQKKFRSFCCLVFAGELQTQNNKPLVANEGEADCYWIGQLFVTINSVVLNFQFGYEL